MTFWMFVDKHFSDFTALVCLALFFVFLAVMLRSLTR